MPAKNRSSVKPFVCCFLTAIFCIPLTVTASLSDEEVDVKIREGLIEFKPNTFCDWAKKAGAGKLDWREIEGSDVQFINARWDYQQWKQHNHKEFDQCHEIGRKYGNLTYQEILDKRVEQLLSPEEYKEWRQNNKIKNLERELKRTKALAASKERRIVIDLQGMQD